MGESLSIKGGWRKGSLPAVKRPKKVGETTVKVTKHIRDDLYLETEMMKALVFIKTVRMLEDMDIMSVHAAGYRWQRRGMVFSAKA
ncbi:MAG: hypothetical protein ACQEP5_04595 [Actinomycetota bacterium]